MSEPSDEQELVVIRANAAIEERLRSRVQPRPPRCPARLFDGDDWQCHRDEGHWGAHVHYGPKGGLSGWRNEAPEGDLEPVEYARAVLRWVEANQP